MNIKTSELIGAALDWAVSDLELQRMESEGEYVKPWIWDHIKESPHPYSTDWMWAGPIIEREKIALDYSLGGNDWCASSEAHTRPFSCVAPLVAAMRCYVASQAGAEIEIPEEVTL